MGVKPIRFQATIIISLLFLMSTPIGQAEENQGNILDIEMGYWINENWIPLTTSFQFEFRLIDPWTGQVIYYEITNDTKIQIDLDDSKPIRPEIRSLENGINVQLLPTISPNSSVTTFIFSSSLKSMVSPVPNGNVSPFFTFNTQPTLNNIVRSFFSKLFVSKYVSKFIVLSFFITP